MTTTREALELAVQAMRAPLDDWKGELERKALDAARKALAQPEQPALSDAHVMQQYRARHGLPPDYQTMFFGHYLSGWRDAERAIKGTT